MCRQELGLGPMWYKQRDFKKNENRLKNKMEIVMLIKQMANNIPSPVASQVSVSSSFSFSSLK